VCGGESDEVVLDLGAWHFLQCPRCGLRVLDPAPNAEELESEFGASYAPYALATRASDLTTRFRRGWYTARRRRWIRGLRYSSVLDVGCGTGEFLLDIRRSGVEVHGLEPSPFAAGYAASLGLDVFQGTVAAYRPERSFDLITLWNVIEHMPDPSGDLARLRDLLAPAGAVVILTPNAGSHQAAAFGRDWAGLEVPKHLQLFDAASLGRLAARTGLVPEGRQSARVDHLYIGVASWVSARRRIGTMRALRLAPTVFRGEDSMLVVRLRRP